MTPTLEVRVLPAHGLVPAPYNPRRALKPGSPAVRAGLWAAFVPAADAAGNPRPAGGPPAPGAYPK